MATTLEIVLNDDTKALYTLDLEGCDKIEVNGSRGSGLYVCDSLEPLVRVRVTGVKQTAKERREHKADDAASTPIFVADKDAVAEVEERGGEAKVHAQPKAKA